MMLVHLEAVSVFATGLHGWKKSCSILTGQTHYQPEPLPRFNPEILPVNERRRITPTIRLALQAAMETMESSRYKPSEVASVFSTSNGDLDVSHRICTALSQPGLPVSPTDFHNSVHNAPAGYWAIGSSCRMASTSISAGRASFAAGLLEAATQVLCGTGPVLLVCYDLPPPAALRDLWQVDYPFAVGFLLSNNRNADSLGSLALQFTEAGDVNTVLTNKTLESLLPGNSAAQSLPLLELIAAKQMGCCSVPYLNGKDVQVVFSVC